MLNVGLTGGIGSGKSEVARLLAGLGAVVIDSDAIAREVVAVGTPGLARVIAEFGDEVRKSDGSLDRGAVAAIVFADDEARGRLNAIVHPLVGERAMALAAAAADVSPEAIVVNDVPLLVESGIADRYDVVVVVSTEPETQLHRLIELRGMTERDARARIAAQAPLADKLAVADLVIRNDGDLAALHARVKEVWADLVARAGRTRAG